MSEDVIVPGATASERLLDDYVRTVRDLVDGGKPVEQLVPDIEVANRRLMTPEFRMPDPFRVVREDKPYTRNLVYRDPDDRFSVLAVCWGAFQETRIHDHLSWCVVGVLEGLVHSIDYGRLDDESVPGYAEVAIHDSEMAPVGAIIGLTPPARSNVHKMCNAVHQVSVSLHTYGDSGKTARVFDPVARTYEVVDLEFHNQ